jgi:hypothetical protein
MVDVGLASARNFPTLREIFRRDAEIKDLDMKFTAVGDGRVL